MDIKEWIVIEIIVPKIYGMDTKLDSMIWRMNKINPDETITMNFKQVDFIRPESVILLLVACKSIYDKTHQIIYWSELSEDVRAYLERLDVTTVSFIKIDLPAEKFRLARPKKKTFNLMELTTITKAKECADAMKRTKEILANWFPEKISSGYCN